MKTGKIETTHDEDIDWSNGMRDQVLDLILDVEAKQKQTEDKVSDVNLSRAKHTLQQVSAICEEWVKHRNKIRESKEFVPSGS